MLAVANETNIKANIMEAIADKFGNQDIYQTTKPPPEESQTDAAAPMPQSEEQKIDKASYEKAPR